MEFINRQFDDYLDYCRYRKRLNAKTLIAYRTDLKQFFAYVNTRNDLSDRDALKRYIVSLHETYKCASIKRKIASVRAYYNYLADEEVIEFNPMNTIRTKFREEQRLPKTMLFQTVQRLLNFVYKKYNDTSRPELLRDIIIIEFLFATGVRVAELCSLKEDDIDVATGKINIFGKGARERIVQICNSEVLKKLSEYKRVFEPEIKSAGYFFVNRLHRRFSEQSVRNAISNCARKAGIAQHITPHMFRHTFATLLLEEDVDIRYIQSMLGHSSIKTTEIYTQVALRKQKEILTLKHPRNKMSPSGESK
jgi:integrase/recombinase XerD